MDYIKVLSKLKFAVKKELGMDLFRTIKIAEKDIQTNCPYHKGGMEAKPSFGIAIINKGKIQAGTCHCFTCNKTVSFEEMISDLYEKNDGGLFGHIWIRDNVATDRSFLEIEVPQVIEPIKEEDYKKYIMYHSYMAGRGVTKAIAEKYALGFDNDFELYGKKVPSITFPVRDSEGECLCIIRRSIKDKFYHIPADIVKPVYGVYELEWGTGNLAVCESIFNALTFVRHGIPAVALLGTGTKSQIEKLLSLPYRCLILAFDGDNAGHQAFVKTRNAIIGKKMYIKFPVPQGKDVNDLTDKEFTAIRNCIGV